jgi:hypothetical protein
MKTLKFVGLVLVVSLFSEFLFYCFPMRTHSLIFYAIGLSVGTSWLTNQYHIEKYHRGR